MKFLVLQTCRIIFSNCVENQLSNHEMKLRNARWKVYRFVAFNVHFFLFSLHLLYFVLYYKLYSTLPISWVILFNSFSLVSLARLLLELVSIFNLIPLIQFQFCFCTIIIYQLFSLSFTAVWKVLECR